MFLLFSFASPHLSRDLWKFVYINLLWKFLWHTALHWSVHFTKFSADRLLSDSGCFRYIQRKISLYRQRTLQLVPTLWSVLLSTVIHDNSQEIILLHLVMRTNVIVDFVDWIIEFFLILIFEKVDDKLLVYVYMQINNQ